MVGRDGVRRDEKEEGEREDDGWTASVKKTGAGHFLF